MSHRHFHGRGAQINPANPYDRIQVEADFDHLEPDDPLLSEVQRLPTEYFEDHSRSVISENDSPDLCFNYSLNPYRGCQHGCSYCYARVSHEYLGLNAGLDFERKIFVKTKAPQLFREFLNRKNWNPQVIVFSGITDCYQPAEKKFEITRQCLEVALEARQPVSIITKNALICRDLDLLSEMAQLGIVHVNLSVTTLDAELARTMEPRTSSPNARLRAISTLSQAGIPVRVMVSPIIPGLNDSEIPAILKSAADAGAMTAGTVLLRLPLTVRPVFMDWLQQCRPQDAERVESRLRSCRKGDLYTSGFGERMSGSGEIADQIRQTFLIFRKKYGLNREPPGLVTENFRPPTCQNGQKHLF